MQLGMDNAINFIVDDLKHTKSEYKTLDNLRDKYFEPGSIKEKRTLFVDLGRVQQCTSRPFCSWYSSSVHIRYSWFASTNG